MLYVMHSLFYCTHQIFSQVRNELRVGSKSDDLPANQTCLSRLLVCTVSKMMIIIKKHYCLKLPLSPIMPYFDLSAIYRSCTQPFLFCSSLEFVALLIETFLENLYPLQDSNKIPYTYNGSKVALFSTVWHFRHPLNYLTKSRMLSGKHHGKYVFTCDKIQQCSINIETKFLLNKPLLAYFTVDSRCPFQWYDADGIRSLAHTALLVFLNTKYLQYFHFLIPDLHLSK